MTGLTAADFTVFENGVRQAISTFAAETSPIADARATSAKDVGTANRRVFLILLGGGRIEGPTRPFEGAARFLRERLRPGDLAAVMAFNRVTELSTDHQALTEIVERVKAGRDAIMFEVFEHVQKTKFQRVDLSASIQAKIDALFQPDGRRSLPMRNVTTLFTGTREFQVNDRDWRPWNRTVISGIDLVKVYATRTAAPRRARAHDPATTPDGRSD